MRSRHGSGKFTWGGAAFLMFVLGGAALAITGLVQEAEADADAGRRYTDTFYDEATSVFCATRIKAVSCVYVPRDTVR